MEELYIVTTGIVCNLMGTLILARSVFFEKPKNVGTFVYSEEENKIRQKKENNLFRKRSIRNRVGIALNVIGLILQLYAHYILAI